MIKMDIMKGREDWLSKRTSYIGGSDAASVLGMNPYKSNIDLWKEKCGLKKAEDISEKPVVKYGNSAEPLIRKLFELDHPEYEVDYVEWNIWLNSETPWAHASLDGWLKDENGRFGVLEIKTTHIQGGNDLKWRGQIPQNYYIQCLHYMLVTDAEFVVLRALLKYELGDKRSEIRDYVIERSEVKEDIEFLRAEERKFCKKIESGEIPSLVLPSI